MQVIPTTEQLKTVEDKVSLVKESIGIATALQVYNGMELPEKPQFFKAKNLPGKVGRFVGSIKVVYAAHREVITGLQQSYHSQAKPAKRNRLLDMVLIATGLDANPSLSLDELSTHYLRGMAERLDKKKLFQYIGASDSLAKLLQKKSFQQFCRLSVVKLTQATRFTGLDVVAVQLYDNFISSLPEEEEDIARTINPYQQALAQLLSEQYLSLEGAENTGGKRT